MQLTGGYMKKVLILANHATWVYKLRKEIILELLKNGYKVYISSPIGDYVNDLEEMGCIFLHTDIQRRKTNPLQDAKLFLNYLKLLKLVSPDIVLTFTIKPNLYGGIACYISKIPYICNVTGLGSSFLSKGIISRVVLFLSRISYKNANLVFFQNSSDKDLLISKNIIKENYDLLPGSGVNLEQYKLLSYPDENEPITFNFIGRVMKDKGIDEYLEAAKIIKEKYQDVIFNVIGMIDQPIYENILNDYQQKEIINYKGFQTNLIPFIEQSSCTINPSYTEGMSNVLLESAACGRPIIASDIPGCKEIISEGINGYTFKVKNVSSLVQIIEEFVHLEYNSKINMGLLGRKKVEQEFNREIIVKKYLEEIECITIG